jgi:hypothetical protein
MPEEGLEPPTRGLQLARRRSDSVALRLASSGCGTHEAVRSAGLGTPFGTRIGRVERGHMQAKQRPHSPAPHPAAARAPRAFSGALGLACDRWRTTGSACWSRACRGLTRPAARSIERAAILAEGVNSGAVLTWIVAHAWRWPRREECSCRRGQGSNVGVEPPLWAGLQP